MKTRLGLSLLLVVMVALAACSSPAPAPQQSTQPPAQVQEETAAPATEEAYPGPQQAAAPATSASVLYPGPKDGDDVTWSQAYAMIMNGEVVKISQGGELQVSLTLKDGRTLVTVEPGKDEVLSVVQRCGDVCKSIEVGSE